MPDFVKSADTKTTPAKSQQEIRRILERHKVEAITVDEDRTAGHFAVRFRLPLRPGQAANDVIEIPVNVDRVQAALRRARLVNTSRERAERIAWRHLALYLDAALTAVQVGLQTVEEAFLAHTLLETEDGRRGRVVDYLASLSGGTNRFPALSSHTGGSR